MTESLTHDSIKSKRLTKEGNIEITTEASGFDRDSNKATIIRQTYTIGKNTYTYKKQVKLEGQADWLERQEFKYESRPCRSKS